MLEKAVQTAEVLQGFIHVTRFLDEAQKGAVEDVLKECVQAANREVDDELFGKERSLPDSECAKEPTVKDKLAPSWARHLGKLKARGRLRVYSEAPRGEVSQQLHRGAALPEG